MKVKNLVNCDFVISINDDCTLEDICTLMKENHISGVPVVDKEGALQGLVSMGQVLHFANDEMIEAPLLDEGWHSPLRTRPMHVNWRTTTAKEAMVSDVVTVLAEDPVNIAAGKLLSKDVHRAVVVNEGGKPIGMITTLDFTRYVADDGRIQTEEM